MRQRVIIGLSGGVDSAVAAHCLLIAGYAVEAVFMKNWEEDDTPSYCAAAADLADAKAVAQQLNIQLHAVNFATEYWERVFTPVLTDYQLLRTPNPDVLCNREIKFQVFLEYALARGAHWIATGHYARVRQTAAGCQLELAADLDKDQTYFLYLLNQQQLSKALFPLADLTKTQVRSIAHSLGLINANKRDSTGICFIGERRVREFFARYLPAQPGAIETPNGQVIGQHHGLAFYTLGQRQGLGIGGIAGANEAPWFVIAKDAERNVLVVAQGEHPLLYANALRGEQLHWIAGQAPIELPLNCQCRLRHRQSLQDCTLTVINQDDTCHIQFAISQRAITPGQSVVFYQNAVCLGGCIVTEAIRDMNDFDN
ncbi:tRNA 2-thiouridine(34) synthase MnmA [Rhodoferax sp. 4810]|uniref:tRNA-specific 2-thiouridylase MnmA n=1 Tax=Thiospirillum jenense TaxID=1653858 RepID=A0A839HFR5_9GAMM|nr:tRNA 2-thiouridine(34) synthase MnmA [Thiospirillum jenense]MBB1075825.1 tRNA 2-thiouridine(34) synthase MnmA [Rhodoferax jenense]MBB1126900.1 tRNA 2-thiouridine(34) synthase MnmA [Thiospirillum jenense]